MRRVQPRLTLQMSSDIFPNDCGTCGHSIHNDHRFYVTDTLIYSQNPPGPEFLLPYRGTAACLADPACSCTTSFVFTLDDEKR